MGTFYKFVVDIRGNYRVAEIPLNLTDFFPNQGHTNYNHQSEYTYILLGCECLKVGP